jgi:1-acyl-sn-glycerol-3-phosphate acyltransferase
MTLYGAVKAFLTPVTRLFFDVQVQGAENVPLHGGLIVAANHRSYLDPPLLGTWFPRTIHYMAKQELFKMPILGKLIEWVHAFPVDRSRADLSSVRRALKLLNAGEAVGIFPEGTRNVSGDVQAKGGAVLLAATANVPLVPVALVRTQFAMRRLRGSHVRIRIGTPIMLQGSERKATKAEVERWTSELSHTIDALAADPTM